MDNVDIGEAAFGDKIANMLTGFLRKKVTKREFIDGAAKGVVAAVAAGTLLETSGCAASDYSEIPNGSKLKVVVPENPLPTEISISYDDRNDGHNNIVPIDKLKIRLDNGQKIALPLNPEKVSRRVAGEVVDPTIYELVSHPKILQDPTLKGKIGVYESPINTHCYNENENVPQRLVLDFSDPTVRYVGIRVATLARNIMGDEVGVDKMLTESSYTDGLVICMRQGGNNLIVKGYILDSRAVLTGIVVGTLADIKALPPLT